MTDLKKLIRPAITIAILTVATFAGWRLWSHYQLEPWTRDGRLRADSVQISPDVAGLVTSIAVANDQTVKKGQLLFTIDRDRYALALRQTETAIATQQAGIATQRAAIGVQRAALAGHRAALAQAVREAQRNDSLAALVAREAGEQSHTKVAQEESAVAQTEAAVIQTEAAVRQAEAAEAQAEAARDLAALNLERTEVRAPVDGVLSDMTLRVGDYVAPGRAVMALIDSASLRVEGYFEETKLPRLHIGQKVEIKLMGEAKLLQGHVVSVAGAIEDRERGPSSALLPNINPTFSWVRLAQRIPVRIALDTVPAGVALIAGRTATVTAK